MSKTFTKAYETSERARETTGHEAAGLWTEAAGLYYEAGEVKLAGWCERRAKAEREA